MTAKTTAAAALATGLLLALLAACGKPRVPDKEHPPEPQVEAADNGGTTAMRDAIQAPIERARAAEQAVQDAADAQREAIDAATD
ncbi:hypothetical protein FKV24_008575 [Lysobacter maris]|uniref:Uncharacterized protein n=1 Tax=Marilutibacter maris TaxID=1605891 RepID=A0A508AZ06_9GAMM|nr:hypothetical protein [Lysobacter maris]KAB8190458.1 hypothetical protein FKV24_008575 [Lysobacter maris]